ncbi:hypothetical protein DOS77_03905 [Staphylococcus felis]|nr:hypothetical protein DOS57_09400 [Staphylococcus felis]REI23480.1 hypothetical protein DOS77_03905 [Staphylococcus felis]
MKFQKIYLKINIDLTITEFKVSDIVFNDTQSINKSDGFYEHLITVNSSKKIFKVCVNGLIIFENQ